MSRGSLSLKEVISVSRPVLWINTGVPFIVGALLTRSELTPALFIGAFYFLFPYNLLLYGTSDIFDYEADIRNTGKYGTARGTVLAKVKHASLWRWIVWLNVPFVLYLVLTGNLQSTVFLIMMIFMALAYSIKELRYREIPFIDSLTSAFHYTSPFILGLFLFESPSLWVAAFAGFYFWAVANHAFGAIQYITPDRKAGRKSIATFLGAGKTLAFCIVAYGLAILAPVLGFGLPGLAAAAAIGPYLAVVLATVPYRKDDTAPQFRAAWRRFLKLNYIVTGIGSLILIYLYNN